MPDSKSGFPAPSLAAAACYLAAVLIGEWWLAPGDGRIPCLSPGAGVLLGMLAVSAPTRWPRLLGWLWLVGACAEYGLAGLADGLGHGLRLLLAVSYSGIDLIGGVLGAVALRLLGGGLVRIQSAADVIRLLLVVFLFSAPLCSGLGTLATWIAGDSESLIRFWRAAWLSSAVGATTLAPITLILLQPRTRARALPPGVLTEALLFGAAVALICTILFRLAAPGSTLALVALYTPFLLVSVAAARGELLGAATANLLATLVASSQTVAGFGPFVSPPGSPVQTLSLQFYLIALQGSSLAIAGLLLERRTARDALRQSESLLRGMVDHTPAAVFLKDTRGHYLLVNRTYARMLGREPEAVLGLTDAELLPPERVDAIAAFDRQILQTGSPLEVEEDLPGPGGPRTWLAVRFPLRDGANQPYALGGFLTDITSRRRAEAELHASERLRRRILDTSPQIIYVLDLAGPRITFLSRRVRDHLGVSPEELLERSPLGMLARIHPDDGSRLREALTAWAQAEDHEVRTWEYRLSDHAGTWRWFLEHGAVFQRSPEGAVLQIVGVVQEVTEQKTAQIALRAQARLGVAEAAIGRALGRDVSLVALIRECLESRCHQFHLRHAALWLPGPGCTDAASAGTPQTPFPIDWPHRSFETGHALVRGSQAAVPLLLDGEPSGVLQVEAREADAAHLVGALELLGARLVLGTRRRQAELEIRRLNSDLENRVHQRTVELRGRVADAERLNRAMINLLEDLQAAQREAESAASRLAATNAQLDLANRELEAFSYSVSHDLRSPLRNVAGFVDLLTRSDDPLDPRTRQYLGVIAQETRRMGDLIGDLLDFSRIGRTELRQEPVDMQALAATSWEALALERQGRQVRWTLDPLPRVHGDEPLLGLVWTNLLANSLKYSRPREVATIHAGHAPDQDRPGQVVFFVRDNGVGFDMKYADKLFGVFQRLHGATEFEGTGIGLANVQRIVHRHGGRVWAAARKDEGATFFFSLPASSTGLSSAA